MGKVAHKANRVAITGPSLEPLRDTYAVAYDNVNNQEELIALNKVPLIQTAAGPLQVTKEDDKRVLLINQTVGAAIQVDLPAVADVWLGFEVTIKDAKGDANTNNITIATPGAETIDGAATLVISAAYGVAKVMFDGTNWMSL